MGLQGLDVIVYVDNQAAVYALIKGTSGSQDLNHLAAFVHAKCAQLHCRLWIEWVPSKCNCSDGLSRYGLEDRWTLRQDWDLNEAPELPVSDWSWPALWQKLSQRRT